MTIKPRTEFAQLLIDCGLSPKSYAELSNRSATTVRNWLSGLVRTPPDVITELREFRLIVRKHFPEARKANHPPPQER